MSARGFEDDIPVTNLNEPDEEEFRIDDEDDVRSQPLDPENLSDIEVRPSLFKRMGSKLKELFHFSGNSRRPFEYLDNIELFDNNHSISSSSFEDLGSVSTDQITVSKKKPLIRKYLFGLLIALFLGFLLGSAALASKLKLSKQQGTKISRKPLLSNSTADFYPTTLIISLDGFHPHYISKELTPFMHQLFMEYDSCAPPYMIPTNPTVTFTNHYTLVTGLKPIYHGIIANKFYDPTADERFVNTNNSVALDPKWWGGEPVWSTAEKQGVSAAVHMWPGSEVKFPNGLNPMYVDKFNKTEYLSKKRDRIFQWLDLPIEKRPELIMSYVPNIDTIGHKYGIAGEHLKRELRKVDKYIKSIYEGISSRKLEDIVNVIIVSDHGMAPTSNSRLIYLDDLVGEKFMPKIQYTDAWPLFGIRPYNDSDIVPMMKEMRKNYRKDTNKNHYNIYLKDEILDTMFGGSDSRYISRVAPLWVIPKVGYSVVTHEEMKRKKDMYTPMGVHGFNNSEVLMRSLFLGTGPFFESRLHKKNTKLQPFSNIEVYNIICDSLNLNPAPNNGTFIEGMSIIQQNNTLDEEWKDSRQYPDVSFATEVLDVESTYDILWSNSTMGYEDVDYNNDSDESNEEEDNEEGDDDEEDQDGNEHHEEDNENEKEEGGEEKEDNDDADDDDDEDDNENEDDKHKQEDKGNENDSPSKGKGKSHKTKGEEGASGSSLWDKLGDFVDDVVEEVEEKIDDFKESVNKGQND